MKVAVFGATGYQGGAVVRALVESGRFEVRAITRNPDSEKAKGLHGLQNVSVLKADLNDPASIDQVLSGCEATFLVTDIDWQGESKETQQGIDLINSAIKNKLKHVVFSGLDHVKTVIGKSCAHFDNKALIEDYGFSHGDEIIFTSIRLPGYFENVLGYSANKIAPNTILITIPLGNDPIILMSVDDTGECVKNILLNPAQYKNKIVGVATELLTVDEMVLILNQHLSPLQFKNPNLTLEKFRSIGFPGCEEMAAMFEFIKTGKFERDIELTKKLNPKALNFNDWVIKNKTRFLERFAEK